MPKVAGWGPRLVRKCVNGVNTAPFSLVERKVVGGPIGNRPASARLNTIRHWVPDPVSGDLTLQVTQEWTRN